MCLCMFLGGCGLETEVYVGFGPGALKSHTVAAERNSEGAVAAEP